MKRPLRFFLVVAALVGMGISLSYSQSAPAVGDFGSVKSGKWSDSTTWKAWDGVGWNVAAPTPNPTPIGSSSSVYVLTGDTVTFDNASSGGTNCKNLYVQAGGVLVSDVALPTLTYLKINGDTIWVDGIIGSGSTDGFSFETRNNADSSVTILGHTGTVNLGQIRPNSSQSKPLTFTFARNVTINYAGGSGTGGSGVYFTGRGSQPSVWVNINAGATVTFGTNSYFGLTSSATTNGSANSTINVNGTLDLPAGSLTLADGSAYSSTLNVGATGTVNVGKKFTPYLSGGSIPTITVAAGGSINILSGCAADFSNTGVTVTGAGQFAVNAGGTISVAASAGLDAANGPIRTTSVKFDTAANYYFIGTGGQSFGALLPSTVNNLKVDTNSVDTLSVSKKVNGTLTVNGSLTIKGGSMKIKTASISGALKVASGGTADFSDPATAISGIGSFVLLPGGTIMIGASAGLDATAGPVRTTTATFDTAANYSYVGSGVQTWGAMLPDSVTNLTIGQNSIDSVTSTMTVLGVLQVDGLLVNSDSLMTVDTAVINGTYQLNTTKQGLPIGKWNTGSLCLITAPVTTATGGIPNGNQNFYNYEVNSPNNNGAGRLGFNGNTIYGNLIIHNTNDPTTAVSNYVALYTKTGTDPINLMGDLLIDSTAGSMSIGTGSGQAIQTLIVHGNVLDMGSLYLNGSGVTNKLFIYGNLTATNPSTQSLRGHSATAYADTIFFAGTSPQKFIKVTSLTNMTNLSFRVMSGSTLALNDTSVVYVSGIGSFTVDSGSTLQLANTGGVNGNFSGTQPALSARANYEFNGDSAQVTGVWLPMTVNNLTVNDSLGLTLSDSVTVNGTLALGNRKLSTTDTNIVMLASTASLTRSSGYVIGNLQKQLTASAAKDFEVGTANGYSPVNVNVLAGSGPMKVKATQGQHPNTFDATKTLARYWTLTADPGITMANLKFSYLASDVHGNESIYGAWRYTGTGTTWTALKSVSNPTQHSVTTDSVTSFSVWTLGESSTTSVATTDENALPKVFFVDQNYPNPFNPKTKISYGLPAHAYVTARVYNILGQEVATLVAGEQAAGVHTLSFDGTRLASGVYIYRIQAGNSAQIKRMVLLK